MRSPSPFNLSRYFSALSLVLIALAGGVLVYFYEQFSVAQLMRLAEDRNTAMTQVFRNTVWPSYGEYLKTVDLRDVSRLRESEPYHQLHQEVVRLMRDTDSSVVLVGDESCQLLEEAILEGVLFKHGVPEGLVMEAIKQDGLAGLEMLALRLFGRERILCRSGKWAVRDVLAFAAHCAVVVGPETGILSGVAYTPVAKVLNDVIGIEKGMMTTIHSYTGDQPTLDTMHKDLYRARAAALSMIPTSTGAAKAVGLVLPELKGKLDGFAIRVPTPNVSVVDLKFIAKRATSVEEINAAIKAAADGPLKGILGYTEFKNVSSDFNHDPHSSVFHMDQTKVMDGTFVSILSWYDNEWGFSNRMADTAVAMGKLI